VVSDHDHPTRATRRVARNAAYLALADAASKVMVFLFHVLAARRLGVERYGVLSFAMAFTTMLGVITDLGLGTIATREVARDPERARSQVSSALTIRLVASVFVIGAIAILVNLLGYPKTTIRIVYICSAFVLANAVATLFCAVFQGYERMELLTLNRTAQTAVLVIGALLLSRGVAAAEKYAFLYVVSGVAAVALAVTSAASLLGRLELSFSFELWRRVLRASVPIGLATVFTMFYYWAGTTVLSKMAGDAAVGTYSAAFRVANGLAFMGFAFSGAVYPLFSRLVARSAERLTRAVELSVRFMFMLVLPVAAFGSVFAAQVLLLLYGPAYNGAVAVLRLLASWGAIASMNSLLSNYLVSGGRSGVVTVQTGVSLAINLCLNLVLIPVFGALGAAMAIAASEAAGLVLLVVAHSHLPTHGRAWAVLDGVPRVLVALAIAFVAAVGVARWNWVAGLGAGVSVYVLLLFVFGAISREDMRMLRPLLRSGNPC